VELTPATMPAMEINAQSHGWGRLTDRRMGARASPAIRSGAMDHKAPIRLRATPTAKANAALLTGGSAPT
jgi:hypothetical protein